MSIVASGTNALVRDDAANVARWVAEGSADLVYLDPPFAVGIPFRARGESGERAHGETAYDDRWGSIEAYQAWLEIRLEAARAIVAAHGTLWLHLDQRAVHEAKQSLDRLFGRTRFVGEVIWVPGNGTKARKGPGMSHQTILIYARGKDFLWNGDDDTLRAPYAATSQAMHFTNTDDDGRIYRERQVGGRTYRYYADRGRALGSVWTDCPSMVANTPLRSEATGYPTQKPLKLLDRIVRAGSRPAGRVVDPFCGSGTTLMAAAALGRSFVGMDVGELSHATTQARLKRAAIDFAALAPALDATAP